jgi:transcriptional regulator with XRE-family HTH domain
MASSYLSRRLKALRENHQLTQREVASYLNLTRQGYSHYETGTRVPDFQTLELIADFYHVSLDSLISPIDSAVYTAATKVEETSQIPIVEAFTKEEQTFLSLFSSLSDEDKEDFLDLVSIKYQQSKLRRKEKQ